MVIHSYIFLFQSLFEIFFGCASFVLSDTGKNVPDFCLLPGRDGDLVAGHPAFGDGDGLGSAKVQHPPVILCAYQLPGASHQVQADDAPAVKSLPERLGGRLLGAHGHSPAHHAVLLCLNSAQMTYDLSRIGELRCCKLLVEKSQGNRIHISGSRHYLYGHQAGLV